MDSEITLPLWLVVILAGLSLALLLDRLFIPSVRWYLRRRVNKVIDEVNTRLDIEIRPFQLTKRQVLIDQLLFDEKVNEAIVEYARENNMPREVAQEYARRYAREIVPSFNAYVYFRVGYWLARRVARLIYRIRVGFFDDGELKNIDPQSTVVFVMNHRSNMDYILVSFLAAERTALSYAVGEWARIWPLQTLIRAMGAFFVRRNSGNPLYRRVLERYVHMATRAGVCQAVFLEGGLTKDGATREPRLGFLDYMLRDYHVDKDRDIVFVPVGINYDRVIEDRSLVRKLDKNAEKRSTWFVIKTSIGFITKHLMLSRRSRWRRFGYAGVNFSHPLSVKAYAQENHLDFARLEQEARFAEIDKLARELMTRIETIIPILPVPLLCLVILGHEDQWMSEIDIKLAAVERIEALRERKAPISISANAYEGVLSAAMTMLLARGFLQEDNGMYRVNPESRDVVRYYANSIAFHDS